MLVAFVGPALRSLDVTGREQIVAVITSEYKCLQGAEAQHTTQLSMKVKRKEPAYVGQFISQASESRRNCPAPRPNPRELVARPNPLA